MSSNIICPNCKMAFEITEVMSAQLRASIRGELEAEFGAARERLKAQQEELGRKAEAIEQQVQAKLNEGRQALERKVREQMYLEIKDREEQLGELKQQLKTAQEKELAVRRKEREIEQLRSQLDQQKLELEQDLRGKMEAERADLIRQTRDKAKEELAVELKDGAAALAELQTKIQQASQKELTYLK